MRTRAILQLKKPEHVPGSSGTSDHRKARLSYCWGQEPADKRAPQHNTSHENLRCAIIRPANNGGIGEVGPGWMRAAGGKELIESPGDFAPLYCHREEHYSTQYK